MTHSVVLLCDGVTVYQTVHARCHGKQCCTILTEQTLFATVYILNNKIICIAYALHGYNRLKKKLIFNSFSNLNAINKITMMAFSSGNGRNLHTIAYQNQITQIHKMMFLISLYMLLFKIHCFTSALIFEFIDRELSKASALITAISDIL